jgi:microcystin-dependent protein
MSEAFIGEIRLFPFNFAPSGWAKCEGQLLSIKQYSALYSVIGVTYGGDGQTTFALPDLRGRVPVAPNLSGTIRVGMAGGEETHTLTVSELPVHSHELFGAERGTTNTATGNVWAGLSSVTAFSNKANNTMSPKAIEAKGGNDPHENMQPYLALNYCICLEGIYPPRN